MAVAIYLNDGREVQVPSAVTVQKSEAMPILGGQGLVCYDAEGKLVGEFLATHIRGWQYLPPESQPFGVMADE